MIKTRDGRADEHTDVVSVNGGFGRPETQSDFFEPSATTSTCTSALCGDRALLVVEKDVRLLLKSALALDCEFCSHGGCEIGVSSRWC